MKYEYDPRALLSKDKEGWLSLGVRYGGLFAERAADELLYGIGYSSTRYWMLRSAIAREDKAAVRVHVNDWAGCHPRELVNISKFVPGKHYHALDMKFNSLAAAHQHIRGQRKIPGGLIEKHVYAREGD